MKAQLPASLITAPSDFLALEGEWNELVRDSDANRIFLTWEWTSAWWRSFGDECELRLWVIRDPADQRLMAVAPLAVRRRRLGCLSYRELVLVGSDPAAGDHLDFIVRHGSEAQALPALRHYFAKACRACDVVNLDGVVPTSATLAPWLSTQPRWAYRLDRLPCPYIELPPSWEAYLASLRGKLRSNFSRHTRALERDHPGQVSFRLIERQEELDAGMVELMRLHQAVQTHHGHAGAFADPRAARFHREVASSFLANGWLLLMLLTVAGEAIGADYAFAYEGVVSEFSKGYAPDWQRYGPGAQLNLRMIGNAIARGAVVYDMLRGAEAYKLELARNVRSALHVQVASSARGLLVLLASQIASRARPVLRNVRRHARQLLAPRGARASVHAPAAAPVLLATDAEEGGAP